jgi:hypothetical protein
MGKVRLWDYEAVIGIGGIGREAKSHRIDGKVNWIGIGPRKTPGRHPLVTFQHFRDYGVSGVNLRKVAPKLARRFYASGARQALNFTPAEQDEVERLLEKVKNAPASQALRAKPRRSACRTRKKRQTGC